MTKESDSQENQGDQSSKDSETTQAKQKRFTTTLMAMGTAYKAEIELPGHIPVHQLLPAILSELGLSTKTNGHMMWELEIVTKDGVAHRLSNSESLAKYFELYEVKYLAILPNVTAG